MQILISGNYNIFNEGWNGHGAYMCSGLYQSNTFKLPIYIGGSETIQERIEKEHIYELNENKHINNIFQNSWNKHSGENNFVWWLLEQCPSGQSQIIEQKYLDIYRPFVDENGGFNISHFATAPMKGRKHTKRTREKMSKNSPKPFLGKKHSCISNEKNRIAHLGKKIGKDNPMFGKIRTIEEKQKISNNSKTKRKIKQIDPITNETIKIWDSIAQAEKLLNNNKRSAITHVCSKKNKLQQYITALSYKWEYV